MVKKSREEQENKEIMVKVGDIFHSAAQAAQEKPKPIPVTLFTIEPSETREIKLVKIKTSRKKAKLKRFKK